MPPPPPPPYPPRRPPPPPPPTHGFQPGEWIPQGEGGQQAQPAPSMELAAFGLSYSAINAFAVTLQGVAAAGEAWHCLPLPRPD